MIAQATHEPFASPVCWAGGKAANLTVYKPYLPADCQYVVEPFAGGAAVSFHMADAFGTRLVLNDVNWQLMALYECLRDGYASKLYTDFQADLAQHGRDYYTAMRALSPYGQSPYFVARRFLYLNHTCFNALWRENKHGEMNTPMGDVRNISLERLIGARMALQGAWLHSSDFEHVLDIHGHPGAFVFLDPPYHPISATASFTAYNRRGWSYADDQRLAARVHELTRRGVKVMLASADVPPLRALYTDERYVVKTLKSRRSMAADGGRRSRADEIVILNWSA